METVNRHQSRAKSNWSRNILTVSWVCASLLAALWVTGLGSQWVLDYNESRSGLRGWHLYSWAEYPIASLVQLDGWMWNDLAGVPVKWIVDGIFLTLLFASVLVYLVAAANAQSPRTMEKRHGSMILAGLMMPLTFLIYSWLMSIIIVTAVIDEGIFDGWIPFPEPGFVQLASLGIASAAILSLKHFLNARRARMLPRIMLILGGVPMFTSIATFHLQGFDDVISITGIATAVSQWWALSIMTGLAWVAKPIHDEESVWVCERCRYDLRGTIMAERKECPECGTPVPATLMAKFRQNAQNEAPAPHVE